MKFLVQNYSCLQNPSLRGYRLQIHVLSVLCPQLNLLNPPRTKFLGTPLILRITVQRLPSEWNNCKGFIVDHDNYRKNKYPKLNQLIARSRALPQRLTGLQVVKKCPSFHETRGFITALTKARHLFLPVARSIQSTSSYPSSGRSILILSSLLRRGLTSGLILSGLPTKTLHAPSPGVA